MKRQELVAYLDEWFESCAMDDASCNGLQVPGSDDAVKMAVAVDASLDTFRATADKGCNFLFVHHGLFWNYNRESVMSALQKEKLKILFDNDISLYAMHLPLDAHPETGNNAVICQKLGLSDMRPVDIGFAGRIGGISFDALVEKSTQLFGGKLISAMQFHHEPVQNVMVVSGGGQGSLKYFASAGFDTFITGEMNHYMYHFAKENKINIILGGHYQTETFGVQATAEHLQKRFGLETVFLDFPTGL
jgi:dinuclear metal center YbgI/SA1388 family protein